MVVVVRCVEIESSEHNQNCWYALCATTEFPAFFFTNQEGERACLVQRNTTVLKNKLRNALCKIYFPYFARDKWSDHDFENCSDQDQKNVGPTPKF